MNLIWQVICRDGRRRWQSRVNVEHAHWPLMHVFFWPSTEKKKFYFFFLLLACQWHFFDSGRLWAWTGVDAYYALDLGSDLDIKNPIYEINHRLQMTILPSHSNESFFLASSFWFDLWIFVEFSTPDNFRWESELSSSLPGCSWLFWFKIIILSVVQTPSLRYTVLSHSNEISFFSASFVWLIFRIYIVRILHTR